MGKFFYFGRWRGSPGVSGLVGSEHIGLMKKARACGSRATLMPGLYFFIFLSVGRGRPPLKLLKKNFHAMRHFSCSNFSDVWSLKNQVVMFRIKKTHFQSYFNKKNTLNAL